MDKIQPETPVIADGMHIEWDIPIEMSDGIVLRADLFRPIGDGRYPVILSMGPYGKGYLIQEGWPSAWELMIKYYPEVAEGSTNKYQSWEVVDPEKWVPKGYACLRIDSRGSGRSPGFLDYWQPRETEDVAECIEWAAVQSWSTGNIGMNGISYFAVNQWMVAKHSPPSLKACCIWEGFSDLYREVWFNGGIANDFGPNTFEMQGARLQYGRGENGPRNPVTGQLVTGDVTLSEEELAANRFNPSSLQRDHPFDDEYYRARTADLSKMTVPFLSAGNWGGQPQHPRGNVEGFVRAPAEQKWLEMHGFEHWTSFYTDAGIALQQRFFDHFLKGADNGWDKEPRVQLHIRHPGEKFVLRMENEWPIARTQWTKFYLDPDGMGLSTQEPSTTEAVSFEALGEGLNFTTPPLEEPLEITGQAAAKMVVSSTTTDADLFLVLRVFDPQGKEVLFRGSMDPKTPVAQGWLRASMRKLDPELSTPYRPHHTMDETQPLEPGVPVPLDIEFHPTSIVVPVGYRLVFTVLGRDFEHGEEQNSMSNVKFSMKGCGPFTHTNEFYRPKEIFGGTTTIHFDEGSRPYVLLPVIPAA
ncbi:CocE/NonD family hydrolase [Amycolatopsis pithecellobii]|uniref:CocE/NonD family hydrolase n=1 Tax=Amycolatopsis pithecellobii TaxID=664692 RepID=A0A6N7Z034_9PSEU|nr:CocE/NonD family hydrolase [Amycolatopsis pithecellobii]MTD52900.1 CocE/NonD family hydrolase [Amycolatopsis pithecellobii]